jgi:DNA polymerase II small subunit/DNA polymerase delta subunit B
MIFVFDSLLGTSGQNLDDIDLQSIIDSRVQILENCLKWGVIAPTCPDTLSMMKDLFNSRR